jgi:hypothetical protein
MYSYVFRCLFGNTRGQINSPGYVFLRTAAAMTADEYDPMLCNPFAETLELIRSSFGINSEVWRELNLYLSARAIQYQERYGI